MTGLVDELRERAETLIVKLRAKEGKDASDGRRYMGLINPNGPEASELAEHLLAAHASTQAELAAVKAERDRCHARLEIDHDFIMQGDDLVRREVPMEERAAEVDGIEARDATIALVEAENVRLKARAEAAEAQLTAAKQEGVKAGEAGWLSKELALADQEIAAWPAGLRQSLASHSPSLVPPALAPASPWRPMKEAPRDGTRILLRLRAPYSRVEIARWFAPWGTWLDSDVEAGAETFGIGSAIPSAWMPLPAAEPSVEESAA